MRIGMLTGGGDCPGLNAVIRAVVTKGEGIYGHEIIGFRHGWRGLIEDETMELSVTSVRSLARRGGTVLGTARTNPFKTEDGVARILDTLKPEFIDYMLSRIPRGRFLEVDEAASMISWLCTAANTALMSSSGCVSTKGLIATLPSRTRSTAAG